MSNTRLWQVRYGDDVDNTFIIIHPGDEQQVKRHFVDNAALVGYVFLTDDYGGGTTDGEGLVANVHVKRLDVVTTGPQVGMARIHDIRNIE